MSNTDDLPRLEYGAKMVLPERDNYSYSPPWGVTKSDVSGTLSRLGRSALLRYRVQFSYIVLRCFSGGTTFTIWKSLKVVSGL